MKSIREILGLSQSEFADELGVERATVSRNELGKTQASPKFLESVYSNAFDKRYGLGLITAKLDTTTRSSIALSIIAMNVNRLTVVSFAQILVSLFSRYKLVHCTAKIYA